jgi:hypothetical protein
MGVKVALDASCPARVLLAQRLTPCVFQNLLKWVVAFLSSNSKNVELG